MLKLLIRFKLYIQLIFALLMNSHLAIFVRMVVEKRALISQSPLKRYCVPGLNCYSCPSAIGSCPIGSLQFWFNDLTMKIKFKERVNLAGLYIIGFLFLCGSICGRLFCGWVCPFGFLQDLVAKITGRNAAIPPVFRSMRYVALALFVIILPLFIWDIRYAAPWFCKMLCPAGTLTAGLPLLLVDEGLREGIGWITYLKGAILLLFLVLFFVSRRAFCKTLCPLGAIWGLFNRFSLFRLAINRATCTNCKKCERICAMNIEVLKTPNSSRCIRCLECLKGCPVSAISFGTKESCRAEM